MDNDLTCCVTGHRHLPSGRVEYVKAELEKEVWAALRQGYTHFISGFAPGVDLMFAEIVAGLKRTNPITLEAALPCPDRVKTPDQTFQRLIRCCDVVRVHSNHYFKGCYMVRNRRMVDASQLVIAVWDGRKTGGTAATLRYAGGKCRDILMIYI